MKPWILVLTMPGGNVYAVDQVKEGLALRPLERGKPGLLKQISFFNSEKEARDWMKQTSELSEQGARLMERVTPVEADLVQ